MKRNRIILTMAVVLSTWATHAVSQEIDQSLAAAVKGAYLCSVAEYTSWPTQCLAGVETPFVIQILGEDPHGIHEVLSTAVAKKGLTVQGHPIQIRTAAAQTDFGNDALDTCHVLFLTRAATKHWAAVEKALADRPVITMAEISGFAQTGGMIEFAPSQRGGGTIGIDMLINLEEVREAELRISAKLLGLKKGVRIVRR